MYSLYNEVSKILSPNKTVCSTYAPSFTKLVQVDETELEKMKCRQLFRNRNSTEVMLCLF